MVEGRSGGIPRLRGVLRGGVLLPFVLLPVPFTIQAPDIWGGYGHLVHQGLALAVLGAVLGALGSALPRGLISRRWVQIPGIVLLSLVAVRIIGVGFGILGGLWVELLGLLGPEAPRPPQRLDLPGFWQPALLLIALRLGFGSLKPASFGPVALACGAAAVSLTAARSALVVLPDASGFWTAAAATLVAVGLPFGLLRSLPASPRTVRGYPLESWGGMLLGALLLPPMLASLLVLAGGEPGPGVAALAVVVGGTAGMGIARVAGQAIGREGESEGALLRAGQLLVLPILPLYPAVLWGMHRSAFLVYAIGLGLAASSWRFGLRPRGVGQLPVWVALWLGFYLAFGHITWFRMETGVPECDAVAEQPGARLLLDRSKEDPDAAQGHPYDVTAVPGTDLVLASFKRWDAAGGYLLAFNRNTPERRARLQFEPRGGPLWPERLEPAAEGTVLTQVIGVGNHGLWEVALEEIEGSAPVLSVLRKLPLPWEPGNPAVDASRDRVVMTYVPNRGGGNPLAQAFSAKDWSSLAHSDSRYRTMQMSDFIAVDPLSGKAYTAALFDYVRFALVEFDGQTLQRTRHRELFVPGIGLAVDASAQRIYVANPLGGSLDEVDLVTFERGQRHPVGPFPRDLVYDAGRRRVWVGAYADGELVAFRSRDSGLAEVARLKVGRLLRGIGLEPASGRVYAASACGIVEIDPAEVVR